MFNFLSAEAMMTNVGLGTAFRFVLRLISDTHSDPLLRCVRVSEVYFSLQLLHLVATPPYMPLLEHVMAGCAAHFVSDRRHLLAIDPSRDYRGDSVTTQAFNADAYEVRCLFHRRAVPFETFKPFVPDWDVRTRAEAYQAMKRRKTHEAFEAKRARHEAQSRKRKVSERTDDSANMIHVLDKLSDQAVRRNRAVIVRAVAIEQDYAVLDAVLRKFKAIYGGRCMETRTLRSFLIGKDLDDGGMRPIDIFRHVFRYG
jgi:hypothetical protein